jgi:hypothetical protein
LKPEKADRFWDLYLGDLSLDGAVVLDPFVGGGTSLVEAGRCGARVIGYDIDPVATFITRFELETASYDPSSQEIADLCATVSNQITSFHRTTVPGAGERVVLLSLRILSGLGWCASPMRMAAPPFGASLGCTNYSFSLARKRALSTLEKKSW